MKIPPLRVVCFGDSITGARPREPYRHAYLKYSDLLQLMLEGHLGLNKGQALNRGFAGATSSQARTRLREDILDEAPDIAVVLIGGNDGSHTEITKTQTRENLHAIFSGVQSAGIRVLALQYHCLPGEEVDSTWHWIVKNNALIAQVACELDIPTLAMSPLFQSAAVRVPRLELVNGEDGVHLHPGGELLYARAIFSRLLDLNWLENLRA